MSDRKENIKVVCKHGFVWNVYIKFSPAWGFATAYYEDLVISQCDMYKLREPMSDSDLE